MLPVTPVQTFQGYIGKPSLTQTQRKKLKKERREGRKKGKWKRDWRRKGKREEGK